MARLYNLARMTVTAGGAGASITLGVAVTGYLTFALAGVSDGETVNYAINDPTGGGSEVGTGVYTAATKALSRTVIKSTDAGAKINVSLSAQVVITPNAEQLNLIYRLSTTPSADTIAPEASDGGALGTTSLMWSDLFLASGAVVNFNNGDVLITHSANALTFTGASSGYLFDDLISSAQTLAGTYRPLRLRNLSDSVNALCILNIGNDSTFNAGEILVTSTTSGSYGGPSSLVLLANLGDIVLRTESAKPITFAYNTATVLNLSTAAAFTIPTTNTKYNATTAPVTKTADGSVADTENYIICDKAGTLTLTLPAAASYTGREIWVKTIQAQLVQSNASNVVPNTTATAGTAILPATDGAWCMMVSDGTNWIRMASSTIA